MPFLRYQCGCTKPSPQPGALPIACLACRTGAVAAPAVRQVYPPRDTVRTAPSGIVERPDVVAEIVAYLRTERAPGAACADYVLRRWGGGA